MSTNFYSKKRIGLEKESSRRGDFNNVDIFSNLSIRPFDKTNNPDLLQKIRENKSVVSDHVRNNFSVYDGKNLKSPNLNLRYPKLIKNFIKGMKKSFFGVKGRMAKLIQEKISSKKNILKINHESNERRSSNLIIVDKNLQINTSMTGGKSICISENINNNDNDNDPKSITNKEIKFKLTKQKQKTNSISFIRPNINSNLNFILNNLPTSPKILNKTKNIVNIKSAARFIKSASITKNYCDDNSNKYVCMNKTNINNSYFSTLNNNLKTKFENISENSKKLKNQIKKDKSKYNSIENILDIKNIKKEDKKLFSSLMRQNGKNKIDEEIFRPQKFLSPIKIKGNIYNIDYAKADLIKYADSVMQMNEETAYKLGSKIVKEYEKKEIEACVDENFEFRKKYSEENYINVERLNKTQTRFKEIEKSMHLLDLSKIKLMENLKRKCIKIKLTKC